MERTISAREKKCFFGIGQAEEVKEHTTIQNKEAALQCFGITPPRLLLSGVTGVFTGTETGVGEGTELYMACDSYYLRHPGSTVRS